MHLNVTLYIKIKQAMSSENLHKMNTRKKDLAKKETKKKIEIPDIEDSDSESESDSDSEKEFDISKKIPDNIVHPINASVDL